MTRDEALVGAVAEVASAWRDPDYEPRAKATSQVLARSAFSEEVLAFAINQRMASMTADALRPWMTRPGPSAARPILVADGSGLPLAGLELAVLAWLAGFTPRLVGSDAAPGLLEAFLREVASTARLPQAAIVDEPAEGIGGAAALLVRGPEGWLEEWNPVLESAGIPQDRRLVRAQPYSIAVVDGQETETECEGLAEDALLYDGRGERSVVLVWAPRGFAPDALLDALASFRGVFPAHPAMSGRLVMQRAFLEATGASHAYGEGLEFLISKGDPEPQPEGHLRWVEYGDLAEVTTWINEQAGKLRTVVCREALGRRLGPTIEHGAVERAAPGEAHRRPFAEDPFVRSAGELLRRIG